MLLSYTASPIASKCNPNELVFYTTSISEKLAWETFKGLLIEYIKDY